MTVSIDKGSFVRMRVRMQIHEEDQPTTVRADNSLNGENRRLFMRLSSIVKSIEIMPKSIHSISAMINPVRIGHRNNQKSKIFHQKLTLLILRKQIVDNSL